MRRLVASLVLLYSATANGEPFFADRIPNARNPALGSSRPCIICHIDEEGGGAHNAFGLDFDRSRTWSSIYDLDSDGDGQTNGLELGDPNGVWTFGQTPQRTTDLSLPGDPTSVSFDAPPDAGFEPPDAGFEPPDSGFAPNDTGALVDVGALDVDIPDVPAAADASFTTPEAGPTEADMGLSDAGVAPADATPQPELRDFPTVICACARMPRRHAPPWLVVAGALGWWLFRRRRAGGSDSPG